jgi:hypothetical protein
MGDVWGSGGLAARITNFGTSWKLVLCFTLQPFHPFPVGGLYSRSE